MESREGAPRTSKRLKARANAAVRVDASEERTPPPVSVSETPTSANARVAAAGVLRPAVRHEKLLVLDLNGLFIDRRARRYVPTATEKASEEERMLERRRRAAAATGWTPLPTARRKKSERPIRTRWSKMPGLGIITCTTDRTCANSSSGCTRDSRWACGRAPTRGTLRTWSPTCGARTRPRWRSSGDRRGARISVKIRLERATDLFS